MRAKHKRSKRGWTQHDTNMAVGCTPDGKPVRPRRAALTPLSSALAALRRQSLIVPRELQRRLARAAEREIGERDWRGWALNVLLSHCEEHQEPEER